MSLSTSQITTTTGGISLADEQAEEDPMGPPELRTLAATILAEEDTAVERGMFIEGCIQATGIDTSWLDQEEVSGRDIGRLIVKVLGQPEHEAYDFPYQPIEPEDSQPEDEDGPYPPYRPPTPVDPPQKEPDIWMTDGGVTYTAQPSISINPYPNNDD